MIDRYYLPAHYMVVLEFVMCWSHLWAEIIYVLSIMVSLQTQVTTVWMNGQGEEINEEKQNYGTDVNMTLYGQGVDK